MGSFQGMGFRPRTTYDISASHPPRLPERVTMRECPDLRSLLDQIRCVCGAASAKHPGRDVRAATG